jgi:DNA-binding LacI/PurR family transcriptional regulator
MFASIFPALNRFMWRLNRFNIYCGTVQVKHYLNRFKLRARSRGWRKENRRMARITGRNARLSDVAAVAGVSKATASNVFNRPELVRAEVRARVLAAARAIGYAGPDPRGRLLSAGKVNAIGVATAEPLAYFFEDPFARALMVGIAEVCDANGIGVSLVSSTEDDEVAWSIRTALVDGLILFCLEDAGRLIASARQRHLPFVALAFGDADASVPVVGIDNAAGAALAASHLAGLGHRRFAVLAMEFSAEESGPAAAPASMERVATAAYADSRERVRGAFEALAAAGIDTARVPVFETRGDATVGPVLDALLAGPAPPTAILAHSDRIAMAALEALKARGLAVPGDVSIVGFDGVPEGALADPPLTTVRQPIAEIGRRAVAAILDHPHEARHETLPVELVVRASTAPPAL